MFAGPVERIFPRCSVVDAARAGGGGGGAGKNLIFC